MMTSRFFRTTLLGAVAAVGLSGCGFSPYDLPLPGGANLGSKPYTVKVEFQDVLDLVPQSGVRVNDIAVGKVTDIKLNGWTALVTLQINKDAKLPDNSVATIRQSSLLGEKFVSLAPPPTGAVGTLGNGDMIPLDRSGRNPEIEEVLGATSLLFNGGGLEKTNTIIKELNNALDGNEPQIKEFIASTSAFLTQLDDNKQALLTSLEKVNRLAVETNKQKSSITGALDHLPAALRVVNQQRSGLVKLLESLDRLSNVATDVVRRSKADTVADFKALEPILRQLAIAGDDLAYDFKALVTYPFTDGLVGNTIAKASGRCANTNRSQNTGACFGDYSNLSTRLDLNSTQLKNLFGGGFDLTPSAGSATTSTTPTQALVDLVQGLIPSTGGLPSLGNLPGLPGSTGSAPQPSDGSTGTSGGLQLPGFCSLLVKCRAAVAGGTTSDLGTLLVEPAVAP